MIDQANKLRDLVKSSKINENPPPQQTAQLKPIESPQSAPKAEEINVEKLAMTARVITVTSGKGGVGKTNCTINLAIQMAKAGKRVVIIDADFGLANIDVLFGLVAKYSFADVLQGEKTIAEALTTGPFGIMFVSGGSGLHELANITDKQMSFILDNFSFLDEIADVVFIDTGAGISNSVINFIKASNETIIITTPEPTSITDAYATIKTVNDSKTVLPKFKIIVNRVDDFNEGLEIYNKLNMVTERFLNIKLENLGAIPTDQLLVKAVKKQQPVSTCFPTAPSTRALESICATLLDGKNQSTLPKEGIKSFMKRLVKIFGN